MAGRADAFCTSSRFCSCRFNGFQSTGVQAKSATVPAENTGQPKLRDLAIAAREMWDLLCKRPERRSSALGNHESRLDPRPSCGGMSPA
jgi:hypothetical protein